MQMLDPGCFIIVGRTKGGKVFRPSDWDHLLCGSLAQFHEGKVAYSSSVRPILHGNDRSVFVDGALKENNPAMWEFLRDFAEDNELVVEWPDVCFLPPETD